MYTQSINNIALKKKLIWGKKKKNPFIHSFTQESSAGLLYVAGPALSSGDKTVTNQGRTPSPSRMWAGHRQRAG